MGGCSQFSKGNRNEFGRIVNSSALDGLEWKSLLDVQDEAAWMERLLIRLWRLPTLTGHLEVGQQRIWWDKFKELLSTLGF